MHRAVLSGGLVLEIEGAHIDLGEAHPLTGGYGKGLSGSGTKELVVILHLDNNVTELLLRSGKAASSIISGGIRVNVNTAAVARFGPSCFIKGFLAHSNFSFLPHPLYPPLLQPRGTKGKTFVHTFALDRL